MRSLPKGRRPVVKIGVGISLVLALVLATSGVAAAATAGAATPHILAVDVFNPFEWLAKKILSGMLSLLRWLLTNMRVAEPQIGAEWFRGQFAIMSQIGLLLTAPVAIAATIAALIKGGLKGVVHTWVVGVPIAALGGAVSLSIVVIAQSIDDNLTNYVLDTGEETFTNFHNNMETVEDSLLTSAGGIAMAAFGGLFMIFGIFFFWFELFMRQVMIYMSVLFLPLGFAMAVWEPTRRWIYGMIEITLVMVFAKFVMTATLVFGLTAVLNAFSTAPDAAEGFDRAPLFLAGMLVMLLSTFAMPALITFVFAPSTEIAGREQMSAAGPWNPGRGAARQGAKQLGKQALGRGR